MYLIVRGNTVIDYCSEDCYYVGTSVVCNSKSAIYENAMIVSTDKELPQDFECSTYEYINGEFLRVKTGLPIEEEADAFKIASEDVVTYNNSYADFPVKVMSSLSPKIEGYNKWYLNHKSIQEVEDENPNLFGGEILADSLVYLAETANKVISGITKDKDAGTVKFTYNAISGLSSKRIFEGQDFRGGVGFEENCPYTIILYGTYSKDPATNLSINYKKDDGSTAKYTPAFSIEDTINPGYYYSVIVTSSTFTVTSINLIQNKSSDTTLVYDKCGVFKGNLFPGKTSTQLKKLKVTEIESQFTPYRGKTYLAYSKDKVYGGSYNWSDGTLTITHDNVDESLVELNPPRVVENLVYFDMRLLGVKEEFYSDHGTVTVNSLPMPTEIDPTLTKPARAADAKITGDALKVRSQGMTAETNPTTLGWKRVAVLMRGNSGTVDIMFGSGGYGKAIQNIIVGYSGYTNYIARNHTKDPNEEGIIPRDNLMDLRSKPGLWQIVNHRFGENEDTTDPSRVVYVDKVRLSYPKSYDNMPGDATNTNEYSNPINMYLEVHITSKNPDFEYGDANMSLEVNIAGHTDNHRAQAYQEEVSVDDVTPLGLNGVECETYELSLIPYSGMYVKDSSRFDSLDVGGLYRTKTVDLEMNSKYPIVSRPGSTRVRKLSSLTLFPPEPLIYLRPVYDNMLTDHAPQDYQDGAIKRYANGVYEVSAGTKDVEVVLEKDPFLYGDTSYKYHNSCPILLKAGVGYTIYNLNLTLMSLDNYIKLKLGLIEYEPGSGVAGTSLEDIVEEYTVIDPSSSELIRICEYDRVVIRATMYYIDDYEESICYYPQLCRYIDELEETHYGVIPIDNNLDTSPGKIKTRERPYSPKSRELLLSEHLGDGETYIDNLVIDFENHLAYTGNPPEYSTVIDMNHSIDFSDAKSIEYMIPIPYVKEYEETSETAMEYFESLKKYWEDNIIGKGLKGTAEIEIAVPATAELKFSLHCYEKDMENGIDTGWVLAEDSSGEEYYYYDKEIPGIFEFDNPDYDLDVEVYPEDDIIRMLTVKKWIYNNIFKITTHNGWVRVYSHKVPFRELDDETIYLRFKAVR